VVINNGKVNERLSMHEHSFYEKGFGEFEHTEIPFHFSHENDLPPQAYIDISINGVSVSLPIDTGDSVGSIRLSPSVLSILGGQYTGKTKGTYDGFGQRFESKQYRISNIHIGTLFIEQMEDFEFLSRYNTPGVVGLAFLRKFNVLLDYPNRRFGLYKKPTLPEFLSSLAWTKVKLVTPNAGIILPLKFKDHDEIYTFLLDTPSTVIDNKKCSYDLIRSRSPLGIFLQQRGIVEPFLTDLGALGRYRSSQFRTACGYPLAPLDFAIVDVDYPKNDGMLGYNFLRNYSVFIDFMLNEMYLNPLGC
jgi:hypothetical protein